MRIAKASILAAAFLSFLLSVYLWFSGEHELGIFVWFSGEHELGIFVGIWVLSILSFGALVFAGNTSHE
jgi:hypothetical protein